MSLQYLNKRFDERMLLVVGGLTPMCIGRLFFLPFPGTDSPQYNDNLTFICEGDFNGESESIDDDSAKSLTSYLRNVDCAIVEEEAPLCQHCWCYDQPGLYLWQMVLGMLLVYAGQR